MAQAHGERAHSKFSASGAERWFNCPGSVAASEGIEDKASSYALEGTLAHEVLEVYLNSLISGDPGPLPLGTNLEMRNLAYQSAQFIFNMHKSRPGSELLVENKTYLDFIHPEMFGTYDSSIVDYFATLDVFDFKYGQGHSVSPVENLQMIFYGLGLGYKHKFNFKSVRLWIDQPRVRGYDGPLFWELPIRKLMSYQKVFEEAVERVIKSPYTFVEGDWCHWCKGKKKCPLKNEKRILQAQTIFNTEPLEVNRGEEKDQKESNEKEVLKSEADWRKEKSRSQKSKRKIKDFF